jgi:hypothetical protein
MCTATQQMQALHVTPALQDEETKDQRSKQSAPHSRAQQALAMRARWAAEGRMQQQQ